MDTPDKNPSEPVIHMSGVSVGMLHDQQALVLEDVNWTVKAGEYWVLAGLQGSGKSDFSAMTAGLMAPQQGSYRLHGVDMPIFEGEMMNERLRIGMVFDGGRLLHNLTVGENVALPLSYHRQLEPQAVEERVKAVLELTDLKGSERATAGNLGRNIQKRVGLARALILQPEVLLLDNPLGGLDWRQAQWWLKLLAQLSAGHEFMDKRRMTLVVATEDLRPWRERASHFAVLRERRMSCIGRADQLAGNTEMFVKELMAEGPHET